MKKFPRLTYDEAVAVLRGEKDVNGENAITSLENDQKDAEARTLEVNREIDEREEKIAAPGIKKGERNFNQNKVDQLKMFVVRSQDGESRALVLSVDQVPDIDDLIQVQASAGYFL